VNDKAALRFDGWTVNRISGEMSRDGKLQVADGQVEFGPGADGWSSAEWLATYAALLQNFLEGYRVAARGLAALLKGPLTEKELVKRALTAGNRMFFAGEIARREAVSKPVIENAYKALVDHGYVALQSDGKLTLVESFKNGKAVKAIEGMIAVYLGEALE